MAAQNDGRIRLAIWFSVNDDIRWLSHRDTMTVWQRGLRRGCVPVRYSQGFNPHMRLTLPLPRSVGMACDRELLLVELDKRLPLNDVSATMAKQLPAGMEFIAANYVGSKMPATASSAQYRITLSDLVDYDAVASKIELFKKSSQWPITRAKRGRHPQRVFDLRSSVTQLELNDETLCFTIAIRQEGTPRIDELLKAFEISNTAMVREVRRVGFELE